MNTYTYELTTWFEGDAPSVVTYGKGGWDFAQARRNRDSALRRTDRVEGMFASATVITDETRLEREASANA